MGGVKYPLSVQDLVKYLTQQLVTYVDTPKENRPKKVKVEKWSYRWFGMLPLAIQFFLRRKS